MHINKYLKNKQVRATSMYLYPKDVFIIDGKELSSKEVDELYPVLTVKIEMGDKWKGENPDKRKAFMK